MNESIQAALRRAVERLGPVSDSPRLDADMLLAAVLQRPRSYLFGHPDEVLSGDCANRFDTLVERRSTGEPVAYILGHKEFWSLTLDVCPEVLVPRPETETLVEQALTHIPVDEPWQIADLGTGSGAIALAIAAERPRCEIFATDVSTAALAVARGNARRLGLDNVSFQQGDWFAALDERRFGLIVSNPPYVSENDPHLQAPGMAFEPRAALIAPGNGLRCLRHLIENAPAHLASGGWLLLEHGADQADFVRRLMGECGFVNVDSATDLAGLARVSYGHLLDQVA